MTRKCYRCGETKSVDQFAKFTRMSWCTECKRAYDRKYYQRNKAARFEQNARATAKKRKILADYLVIHPCVDCGETDPIVLDFDHVRGKKEAAVTTLAWNNASIDRIEAEIAKCEVVCANCHRRRTHGRRTIMSKNAG